MNFKYQKYIFSIEFDENGFYNKFLEALFRGSIGYSLKEDVCKTGHNQCNNCNLKHECIYIYLFETPPPPNIDEFKYYNQVPKPYSIYIKHYDTINNKLEIELTLFGKAINYYNYFIKSFIKLGEIGISQKQCKYNLVNVILQSSNVVIYDNLHFDENNYTEINFELDMNNIIDPSLFDSRFFIEYPIRIRHNNRFMDYPLIDVLFNSIARRISLLSIIHDDGNCKIEKIY